MTFSEFINVYGNDTDCKKVANSTEFEQDTVTDKDFEKLYLKAVRLGLCAEDAAVFQKKFKVYPSTKLSAEAEGLTDTEYCCKIDPWSIWYAPFLHDLADGKLSANKDSLIPYFYDEVEKHKEEVTKKMTDKSYRPSVSDSGDTYTTKSGVGISYASRITAEDLEKYKMPDLV